MPDCAYIHQELKRKGVTLMLLWEEYQASCAGQAYQYAQFCVYYRQYRSRLKLSMRQTHKAGEKLFVDYSGDGVPIVDPQTGEIRRAQIFVAVLGAPGYTFAEATLSQKLPDWIGSHVRLTLGFRAKWLSITLIRDLEDAMYNDANEKKWNDMQMQRLDELFYQNVNFIHSYLRAVKHLAQFGTYEKLFSLWHVFHVPFVYMLAFSAVWHVIAVHMY